MHARLYKWKQNVHDFVHVYHIIKIFSMNRGDNDNICENDTIVSIRQLIAPRMH